MPSSGVKNKFNLTFHQFSHKYSKCRKKAYHVISEMNVLDDTDLSVLVSVMQKDHFLPSDISMFF